MFKKISTQQSNGSDLSPPIPEYQKYGFEVDGIEGIDSRFKCIFCSLIIRDAIQLSECGHRSCRSCFEVRAEKSTDGNVTCPCEDCQLISSKNQTMSDKAFTRELDSLSVVCKYRRSNQCAWIGFLKSYQAHIDEIHVHYNCPVCNERLSSQVALDEHLKICPEIFQACPLGSHCTEELIRKTAFADHLRSEKHQETVAKSFIGEYNIPEPIISEEQNQINREIEAQTSQKLNTLANGYRTLDHQKKDLEKTLEDLERNLRSTAQELNILHSQINERNKIKQTLQPSQEVIQKEIEQLYELCNNTQHISVDGTLTWRIDQVSEKMADAQSERQTSIYSPIFYSSPTGYKMRVRLFLFGDGNARRTHISLFFLLMKGDYDSILKWPFHYKITFCLLDQTGTNRHITDSFYPDVKSNSFQRPKDATNTASGIPKFFPLPMLLQDDNVYVRENTMYLKIIVALNETPKAMLPFMLTLNPALPSYVQENLISQEAAKQQQQQQSTTAIQS